MLMSQLLQNTVINICHIKIDLQCEDIAVLQDRNSQYHTIIESM